ncbi:MAG: protease SohB [Gammaproteobacteria bacterium]|nr:protease SohB [Pseudomonadales bacterium]MCP5346347.1 protease SohB [Pseudomonadales bacterium]
MEYLIEYGMFLAKVVTLVLAVIVILVALASAGNRQRKGAAKGHIKVTKLNEHLEELLDSLKKAVLDKHRLKLDLKSKKKQEKAQGKSERAATRSDSDQEEERKKRIYVLNFKGDIAAQAVASLREEITAILALATDKDEVMLRLESPGGMVHAYGLASSQLMRIKAQKIPLTICVDKVAASGGYMMACLADKLVAAPFAIIGSIGVLVQLPNFHRLLKKNEIDYETITAGEFKTTLTPFGEITQKGRDKVKQDVEDMHALFKQWVKDHRPSVDIDRISTGETWVGIQAKERYMVDELKTSDECLVAACESADVYEVEYELRKTIHDKVGSIFRGMIEAAAATFMEKNDSRNFYS